MFLFLDVVADVLRQHRHLGVEALVFGAHPVELREHPLDDVVLLQRFQDHVFDLAVLDGLADGRIKDHFLDGGVDGELADDALHHVLLRLDRPRPELLEALEQVFHGLVIVLQQRDCVHGRSVPGRNCQQTAPPVRSDVRRWARALPLLSSTVRLKNRSTN